MTYDVSDYGKCESCDQYNRVLESGFCVGCIWTLLTDGTYLRSGWTPKKQITISFASENHHEWEK